MTNLFVSISKKLIVSSLYNPERTIKNIFFIFFIPLFVIAMIFALPIMLFTNIPTILLESNVDSNITDSQLETISMYQSAPHIINQNILNWIEHEKEEYSWCDDIVVSYDDFDLTWQYLMAIDSVLLEQNFSDVDQEKIITLGDMFFDRSVDTETYKERKTYKVVITDEEGNQTVETRTRIVTKHRAIIKISMKHFDDVLNELGFDDFKKNIANNIFNNLVHIDIERNLNIYDNADLENLKVFPPGNANIPYFNQTDKRWGNYPYGKTGTIKSSGCGPTALAMVVSGLTGRTDINPKVIADWAVANGHRIEGNGSAWSLMTEGGRYYGLKVESVSRKNPKKIVEALSSGYPVIASMGPGHFTRGGHFIVLHGITNDGKILVYDPASVSRSKAWDLSIIMNESSTNGGVYGSPFWIFKP